MVLSGSINKELVMEINKEGGLAVGLSGKDALLVETTKINLKKKIGEINKHLDLGFVGLPKKINNDFLNGVDSDFIPVISPIGYDKNFKTFNINLIQCQVV